jgi:ribonuclease P protein component
VGIIVRKQGQTAADRNRVKRRLRELVRLYLLPAAESMDFVIRTRDGAYTASFEQLRADLQEIMKELRRAL